MQYPDVVDLTMSIYALEVFTSHCEMPNSLFEEEVSASSEANCDCSL